MKSVKYLKTTLNFAEHQTRENVDPFYDYCGNRKTGPRFLRVFEKDGPLLWTTFKNQPMF